MLRLRLFRKDDPSTQIDSRPLGEDELVIGRDAKADWPIADPDRGISRRHLVVSHRGGLVTVRDTSSNGVFLGDARERVVPDRPVPIERGETIRFGNYVLVLEEDSREADVAPAPPVVDAPFGQPDGGEDRERRDRHPFASALKADPFVGGAIGATDAWEQRPEASAGSWDASGGRRPEHTTMIGAERAWVDPTPVSPREAGFGFDAPFERPILERPASSSKANAIPSDWMEAGSLPAAEPVAPPLPVPAPASDPVVASVPPPVPELLLSNPIAVAPPPASPETDGKAVPGPMPGEDTLFEHFCAGAGLNPNAFAGEDRARVMERLGGIYRQAVLGIADLMRERTTLRNEYRMVHTAVQPEGNNPFKWVPPQRIAVELLRDESGGYITGERALNDALGDVKGHLLCMLAGMRAALSATFDALSPSQVEARLGGRSYLIAVQRDAALWAEYVAVADALRVEAEDNPDGLVNRAFRQGYEEQAAALVSRAHEWR